MKVLVLLSLAAFCFAQSTYGNKQISVWSNGIVSIHGDAGQEIVMYQNSVNPNQVNVVLKSIYGPATKIVVDAANNIQGNIHNILDAKHSPIFQNLGTTYTQYDVLVNLFHQHEGLVNAIQYQELLETIHHLVQLQIVHQTIEDVLQHYFTQQSQQWVANYINSVPTKVQYGVGSYSPVQNQNLTPLQTLQYLIQQHQNAQEHQNGQGYQTVYPYVQQQGSAAGSQSLSHQMQYQTPLVHQQAFIQGPYHQYPQGMYQKQSWVPQQWWNGQQSWNSQNMWNPQQYSASQQYQQGLNQKQSWVPQQWWNGKQWWNTQNMWNPQQNSVSQQLWNTQNMWNPQQNSVSQQWWNTQNMWNPQQNSVSQQLWNTQNMWNPQQNSVSQQLWNTQNMWNPQQNSVVQQNTPYQQVGNSQQYSASQQYTPVQQGILSMVY